MNNGRLHKQEDLAELALKSGRQVTYEDDLLFELLDIEINDEEEGQEILKELTGERLFLSSAIPLTKTEKLKIAREFMRITGFSIRSFTTIINPDLIIGVRLQSERFYYELSGGQILQTMQNEINISESEEVISS
ncbi:F0F1 ATP synthase subunit delta [Facklamia sp. P12955]|uniref:F0F1 ATP synthase subunit delta n=1 Tax=Facklamia sp. P12955 TaxID=3421946 RepID=UPI003D17AEAA